jgi:hypothetical protein
MLGDFWGKAVADQVLLLQLAGGIVYALAPRACWKFLRKSETHMCASPQTVSFA